MPANIRGATLGGNNSTNIKTDSKTFTLSFAAHIGNDKPADTYENEVTMSVVSSPLEITNAFGVETMQEMTSKICSDVEVGTTDRLRDTRDDKMYWVKKMPDNQCWMVQNLDLDLGTSWPDASESDYDVATDEYTPNATQTQQTTTDLDVSQTNTRSWDFGEWVVTNPSTSSSCSTGNKNLSTCTSQFTDVTDKMPSTNPNFYRDNANRTVVDNEYDAIGNHYSWNTATAGTGGEMISGNAAGSICPKNWKLPTSNNTSAGSFGGLINDGGIGSDVAELTGDGYFFVRGGGVWQNANLFGAAGNEGHYWSSTPSSGITSAYNLYFNSTASVSPSNTNYRYYGYSVRCIAR